MKTSLPFSVRFRLRKGYKSGEQLLQCRLRVNGSIAGDFFCGIRIPADTWNVKTQCIAPDHPQFTEVAGQLAAVKAQIKAIVDEQKALVRLPGFTNLRVSGETVKRQFLGTGGLKAHLGTPLLTVYADFLAYLKNLPASEQKAEGTLKRYQHSGVLLAEYLENQGTPGLVAESVTTGWGRQYFDWLRSRPMKRDPAAKHIGLVRLALQHALDYDRIPRNPLYEFRLKRDKPKRIVYLSDQHLADLWTMKLVGTADVVRKWALLMCYTGLDYLDAVKVAADYNSYRVEVLHTTVIKSKLVYQRLKANDAPDWGECHIPVLPEAESLLVEAHDWRVFELQVVNRFLHVFESLLSLPFSLTTKVCRKTAGALFLTRECPVEVVQKVLGHKSVKTTEGHYISLPGQVVDRHIQRMNRQADTHSFHIHKAS